MSFLAQWLFQERYVLLFFVTNFFYLEELELERLYRRLRPGDRDLVRRLGGERRLGGGGGERRLSLNLGGEARHLGRGLRSGLRRGITRVGRGANTAAAVIS